MGNKQTVFSKDELDDYQELTYFSKNEILNVYKRFSSLDPPKFEENKNASLPMETILRLPELHVNPFGDRICTVFSSNADGSLTFEDFLDMMSVFSDRAPRNVKAEYAFRIYDFDGDDQLAADDLEEIIVRLSGGKGQLNDEEIEQLINNVLEESDLDDDNTISFAEFEHVIGKAPDFVNSFRIRM